MVAGAIGLAGLGAMTALAASTTLPTRPIVQKIAQKFGLKEADVRAVFDQDKADHVVQMKTNLTTKLDQEVKDGKITAAQEQAILDEMSKLATQHQADQSKFKNMTPAERKAALQQHRQEIEDWTKQNNLDLKNVPFGPREFGLRGHHGPHMMGDGPEFKSN